MKKLANQNKKERDTQKKKEKNKGKAPSVFKGLGRHKGSVAKVLLDPEAEKNTVNQIEFEEYFPILAHKRIILEPLKTVSLDDRFKFTLNVKGGGKVGQAKAARLAIARALVNFDSQIKKTLKKKKLLTRDPRKKERKKPGLKRARRAPQWQKR